MKLSPSDCSSHVSSATSQDSLLPETFPVDCRVVEDRSCLAQLSSLCGAHISSHIGGCRSLGKLWSWPVVIFLSPLFREASELPEARGSHLFCLLLYLQHLEQCVAHTMDAQFVEGTLSLSFNSCVSKPGCRPAETPRVGNKSDRIRAPSILHG